ncbi:MAG: hypothetical protein ACE5MI_10375 [Acidimicrobiia bacterium]
MDPEAAIAGLEGALDQQLVVAGADPVVEEAARALMAALQASIKELTIELASAAAAEIQAQLPDYNVEVLMEEGEPRLSVRPIEAEEKVGPSEYEARVTVRLPDSLKELIEASAGDAGDSVNTWIVKALSSKTRPPRGSRVSGIYEL